MAPRFFDVFCYSERVKKCPECGSLDIKKNGIIEREVVSKNRKRIRKIQAYRCSNGHFFTLKSFKPYTNSFIEFVVYVYLRSLSLNATIDIVRAFHQDRVLSKRTILDFVEKIADVIPTLDDIDNLFHPQRSGYIALDGVWFKFKGIQIVLLVCFDPNTFDVIDTVWSKEENTDAYTDLLNKVIKKLGQKNIKGIYGDGDKGLINSLKLLLPNVPFQICIVHKEMRMGQIVPVKLVNRYRRMKKETKEEIKQFQKLFRSVIYAQSKQESLTNLKRLKLFRHRYDSPRFKKAFVSLLHNFNYTLTHFDHPNMIRDNNLLECFNGIIKPRLKLMKGFKKYDNLDRYLKLFLLEYRFRPLRESRFKDRRGLSPLEIAGVHLPKLYNFLSFLRTSLNLNFQS